MNDLDDGDREELTRLADAAIRSGLERRPITNLGVPAAPALNAIGAAFVTLERAGKLLGCIGTIEAVRPLYEDVMQNAYRAAFADPRLPAVTAADYEVMSLKVSVLSPLTRLYVHSRVGLLAVVRPNVDGLLLGDGRHRGTFLQSVWDNVDSPEEFVSLLLRKAGLPAHGWPAGVAVWRYTTEEFGSCGPRPPVTPGSASDGRR